MIEQRIMAKGYSVQVSLDRFAVMVSPAYAGVLRPWVWVMWAWVCQPRRIGGVPTHDADELTRAWSAPQERGYPADGSKARGSA